MLDKLKALVLSRRFYVALGGAAIVLLQDNLGLEGDMVEKLVYVIVAWIAGDSISTTKLPG